MKHLSVKAKWVEMMITNIQNRITIIAQKIKINKDFSTKDYTEQRVALNTLIIQALTGGNIIDATGDEIHIRFNKPLPKPDELNKIVALVEDFKERIENPFLAQHPITQEVKDDDMSINPIPLADNIEIPDIDKITYKKFAEALFNGKKASIVNMAIGSSDCIKLYAMACEAKKNCKRKAVVLSGIALAAFGVAAALLVSAKNKKEKEATDDTEVDVDTDDIIDDVDIDDCAPSDDDIDDLMGGDDDID